jgi:ATP-binding protein involved in chromosome partitioning
MQPVERYGVSFMSVGFLLSENQPLDWDASLVRVLVLELLEKTEWGELDCLMIDLPPGTGEVTRSVIETQPLSGAILVTTPHESSHLDSRKAFAMYRNHGVRVLGAVENMAYLTCPHCAGAVRVYPPVPEHRSIWALGLTKLGSIPLCFDETSNAPGALPALGDHPLAPGAVAFEALARVVGELFR